MAEAQRENPIERRATKLADELEVRTAALERLISEPHPPFHLKLSPAEQLSRYVRLKATPDGLLRMRESMGGTVPDDRVDEYVVQMERLLARQAPGLVLDEHAEREGYGQSPLGPRMLEQEAF